MLESSIKTSLADPEQVNLLYQQACDELDQLEPTLNELEQRLVDIQQQYQQLKQNKQRLLTIKLSLQGLVAQDASADEQDIGPLLTEPSSPGALYATDGVAEKTGPVTKAFTKGMPKPIAHHTVTDNFSADVAFHEVNQRLRQRDSVNYEIFRAIVYQGGRANTEQVKQYLVEQGIKQPATGDGFDHVTLADISARVNYLVKKGLVIIEQRGQFKSVYGWL
jgi:TolA-binding protein